MYGSRRRTESAHRWTRRGARRTAMALPPTGDEAMGECGPIRVLLVTPRRSLGNRLAAAMRGCARYTLSGGGAFARMPERIDAGIGLVVIDLLAGGDSSGPAPVRTAGGPVPTVTLMRAHELLSAGDRLARTDGVLFAENAPDHVGDALDCARSGHCLLPRVLGPTDPVTSARLARLCRLSDTERRVLVELGAGRSNSEIAKHLGLPRANVKAAVQAVLRKLYFGNRTEVAVFYTCHQDAVDALGAR